MGPIQEAMPGLAAGTQPNGVRAALLDGARREAMARAGRLLASRPRSEKELGDRLAQAGFEPAIVEAALDRLRSLGLVNDEDFALQWIEERASRKKLSSRAVVHELRAKGVPPNVAVAALARAGVDEEAQALELAARYARRFSSKPPAEQFTRIHQALTRRGYSYEIAESAARKVLPPDGWD
jgi:regulatory protein